MQDFTPKISIDNLDKFDSLSFAQVKNFVKKNIKELPSYSENEENLLISLATDLPVSKLILVNEFDRASLKKIKKYLVLRLKNKPLNKISKSSFFYTEKFYINKNVLAPRQETELLVDKVISDIKNLKIYNPKILDLCCGSGVIGLTLAKHIKNSFVTLSDVSFKALKVAKKNRKILLVSSNTKIVKSNMFRHLKNNECFDIIISNPPYIKTNSIEELDDSVKRYDPIISLDGGQDGLKFYKIIASEVKNYLSKNGKVYLEIGYNQGKSVKNLFEEKGFKVKVLKDYANLDRIVIASF